MSAIAGVFHVDGRPVARADVTGMMGALAHRGGDGVGVWCDGAVGVGHATRAVTAEGRADAHEAPRRRRELTIVADARIDNRSELASLLGLGAPLSDCETILAAYEQWGRGCAERLIGDFAFAIWDGRRRELFCARDAIGVKPLYWVRSGTRFAFASEAKALFALPDVSREVDEEQVALFLGWSHEDRGRTLYRHVRRLPAAYAMVVSERDVTSTRYWSPAAAPDVRFATDGEYVERFRELFGVAVRDRLRSEHAIASSLSGGLDSSAIVCEARRRLSAQGARAPELHAISIVFPDVHEGDRRLIDERAFAERVIEDGGVHAHFVRGDEVSPLTDLERVLWHVDEPYFAPNLYLHWAMYGAAKQAGARVFLDGFDGDTSVSHGLGRLNSLAQAGDWDTFEAEVRAFARHRQIEPSTVLPHFGFPYLSDLARSGRLVTWRRAAGELARRFQLSRRDVAVRYGVAPLVPAKLRRAWKMVRGGTSAADRTLFTPAVSRLIERAARVGASSPRAAGDRAMHVEGLSQPGYQLTLEIADKSAAAFGLEPRYPFFDRRLMEFCLGIPEDQKFGGGWGRLLFRRAMDGVLPREIQWRSSKANLSPNFHRRFREADQTMFEHIDHEVLGQYVDVAALRAAFRRYRAEWTLGDSDATGCMLFRAAVLAAWLAGARAGETARRHDGPHRPVAA